MPGGNRKSRLYFAIALFLAGILLYFSFRDVSWEELFTALQRTRVEYLIIGAIGVEVSLFLRSQRWRCLLSAEKDIARLPVFWATSLGYMGNILLPARAGELVRSMIVSRMGSVSTTFVLATTLTERVLDAIILVLVTFFAIASMDVVPPWLSSAATFMGAMGVIGVVVLFALPRFQGLLRRVLALLPLPLTLHNKLVGLMEQFLLGMLSFQHAGRAVRFAGFAAAIWLLDSSLAVVVGRGLNLDISLPQAMVMLAAIGLSSAAPSTPGYVGIYQFVAVTVLASFGFPRAEALAYSFLLQATTHVMFMITGFVSLGRLGVDWRALRKSEIDHAS